MPERIRFRVTIGNGVLMDVAHDADDPSFIGSTLRGLVPIIESAADDADREYLANAEKTQ